MKLVNEINQIMVRDFNSIIGAVEKDVIDALKNYAKLNSAEINAILREQPFIETYIQQHCVDLFSLGWMIGYEEKYRNSPSSVEELGQESRDTLQQLLLFLKGRFPNELVIDIFHDIGLAFFNNGHSFGSDYVK